MVVLQIELMHFRGFLSLRKPIIILSCVAVLLLFIIEGSDSKLHQIKNIEISKNILRKVIRMSTVITFLTN